MLSIIAVERTLVNFGSGQMTHGRIAKTWAADRYEKETRIAGKGLAAIIVQVCLDWSCLRPVNCDIASPQICTQAR